MGKVNLINANFIGKVGAVYGTKQRGKSFLKAVPFSHAPHSASQSASFSAFSCLNRFSSGLSKVFFPYLGLKNSKLLKHNQVAHLFKPLVQNHVFSFSKLPEVVKVDDFTKVEKLAIDFGNSTIQAEFSTFEKVDKKKGLAWVALICDTLGNVITASAPSTQNAFLSASLPLSENLGYYAFAFRADKHFSKVKLHGLSIVGSAYVIGETLVTDNFPNYNDYSVDGETLVIDDDLVSVKEEELVFNFD